MKCQIQFSGKNKNKKNVVNLLSAEYGHRMVKEQKVAAEQTMIFQSPDKHGISKMFSASTTPDHIMLRILIGTTSMR